MSWGQDKNLVVATAVTLIVVALGLLFPFLQLLLGLVWAVPLAVVVFQRGLPAGMFLLAVTGLVLLLLAGPVEGLVLLGQFGVLGLVLGYLLHRHYPVEVVILGGAAAAMLTSLTGFFFILALAPGGLGAWEVNLRQMLQDVFELYRQMGWLDLPPDDLEHLIEYSLGALPGLMMVMAGFSALANYLFSRIAMRYLGYRLPAMPRLAAWRFPWYTVWFFILGLAMVLFGDYTGVSLAAVIGQGILYFCLPLCFMQGLAVVVHYYFQLSWSFLIKWFIVIVLVIYLPATLAFISLLGLFDFLFNFRKLK